MTDPKPKSAPWLDLRNRGQKDAPIEAHDDLHRSLQGMLDRQDAGKSPDDEPQIKGATIGQPEEVGPDRVHRYAKGGMIKKGSTTVPARTKFDKTRSVI